jgi:Antibiotic biosynthesis monooxygenase
MNSRSTFVITHVDIGGQGTNATDLLRKLAEASRKEEGNLRFDVLQHAMSENHFTVIEEWQAAKQSRRMRLRLTRRNTGTALGRSPAALWTNVFIKSWSKTHALRRLVSADRN